MLPRADRNAWFDAGDMPDGLVDAYVEALQARYRFYDMSRTAGGPTMGICVCAPWRDPVHPRSVSVAARLEDGTLAFVDACTSETGPDFANAGWRFLEAVENGRQDPKPALFVPFLVLLKAMREWFARPHVPGTVVGPVVRRLWVAAGPAREAVEFDLALHPEGEAAPAMHGLAVHLACRKYFLPLIDRFLALFDAEALDLLHGVADAAGEGWTALSANVGVEEWKALDATFMPSAPLKRALKAYPGHLDVVCEAWRLAPGCLDGETLPGLHDLADAMFPGRGPTRAVALACLARETTHPAARLAAGTGRWAVPPGHAGTLSPGTAGGRVTEATSRLLTLGGMPDSWIPRGAEEWDAFDAVRPTLAHADALLRCGLDPGRFVNSGGRWAEAMGRLSGAAGDGEATVADACTAVAYMVDAFAYGIVVPAAHLVTGVAPAVADLPGDLCDRACDAAEALLLGGRSLARVLEASEWWRRREPGMAAALAALPSGSPVFDRWEAGLPNANVHGVDVACLVTAGELAHDGGDGPDGGGRPGLSHCVARYAPGCLLGEHRILSLRRPAPGGFERLSTAMVGMREGYPVLEHAGFANAPAPAIAEAALAAYLDDVRSGRQRAAMVAAVAGCGPDMAGAGYDWSRPGNFAAAVAMWSHVLPAHCEGWAPVDYVRGFLNELDCQARPRRGGAKSGLPAGLARLVGWVRGKP